MSKELKGYRVRVVVDYPCWDYTEEQALEHAKKIAENSHSACKIMSVKCILCSEPDNYKLFPEDLHE